MAEKIYCPTCKQSMTKEHWDRTEELGLIQQALKGQEKINKKQQGFNKILALATSILAFDVIYNAMVGESPTGAFSNIISIILSILFFFIVLIFIKELYTTIND